MVGRRLDSSDCPSPSMARYCLCIRFIKWQSWLGNHLRIGERSYQNSHDDICRFNFFPSMRKTPATDARKTLRCFSPRFADVILYLAYCLSSPGIVRSLFALTLSRHAARSCDASQGKIFCKSVVLRAYPFASHVPARAPCSHSLHLNPASVLPVKAEWKTSCSCNAFKASFRLIWSFRIDLREEILQPVFYAYMHIWNRMITLCLRDRLGTTGALREQRRLL